MWKSEKVEILVLTLVYLLSRLLLWPSNWGVDPDAWRIGLSGLRFAETGEYVVSRFPGYPVAEIMTGLLLKISPVLPMVFILGLGLLTLWAFYDLLGLWKIPQRAIWTLLFIFIPNFYINSLTLMDYSYSFFFYVLSLSWMYRGFYKAAAILLGLAIASRITYGAMLLPMALYFYFTLSKERKWLREFLIFSGFTLVSALLFFSPVLIKYGKEFFTFYPNPFSIVIFAWKLTVGFWGLLGTLAAGLLILNAILGKRFSTNKAILWPGLLTTVLYLVAFIRMPAESAYLLPILPWFFYFVGFQKQNLVFKSAVLLMLLSPFAFHVYKDGFQMKGAVLIDLRDREKISKIAEQVVGNFSKIKGAQDNILITGYYAPALTYELVHKRKLLTEAEFSNYFAYTMNAESLQQAKGLGKKVFILPDQLDFQKANAGQDASDFQVEVLF